MNQKEIETLIIFTWEMLPLILPLTLIGVFIIGTLLHYIESEIKYLLAHRRKS